MLRYFHFLASAHLAYLVIADGSSFQKTRLCDLLRTIGRNSLPTFGLSVVLSVAAYGYLMATGGGSLAQVFASVIGLTLITLFAIHYQRLKAGLKVIKRPVLPAE